MTTSLIDAQSVLAVDIGSIHTRAVLFDVVDGEYHFIAAGTMPTTINAPYNDAREGILLAVQRLEEITGRSFLDPNAFLVVPSQSDGSGVDRLVITYSAGPEMRLVTAGLLPDVSLESAQRLAASSYGQVVESIGLNDRRPPEVQLDAILRARPDVIILVGGTERGATRSVMKMVDLTAMVCRLLPQEQRPQVLYAGNGVIADKVKETLEKLTGVVTASNVRPTVDSEDLRPAMDALAQVTTNVRRQQIGGMHSLSNMSAAGPMPTAQAFGRMLRFLSQRSSTRSVLGVDIGASASTFAAAASGRLYMNVMRPFGLGAGILPVLQAGKLEEIILWLPLLVAVAVVEVTIWQKSLYPASLPLTGESLAIEQGLARQILRLGMQQLALRWPGSPVNADAIIASGAVFANAATPGQALLMLLDGLQPAGLTHVYLDQYMLLAGMGAAAEFNPMLPIQVLDSGALLHLGTVLAPVSAAKYGTPILKLTIDFGDGNVSNLEIKQGTLTVLPLRPGQKVDIGCQALRKIDNLASRYTIVGGACGAVIDARGRPLSLPPDAPRRREMLKKWALALS
jgi:hypothetical protein